MKTTIAILSVMILTAGLFTGCKNSKSPLATTDVASETAITDTHNSRNSLDYEGAYEGILPCADCEGIKTVITLGKDSYIISREYLGKSAEPFKSEGKYGWDSTGSIIILEGEPGSNKYRVGENVLIHLNSDGSEVTGELAEYYKLKKTK